LDSEESMRVFLTGASGFLGKRLVRELLRRGDQVVALTRSRKNLRPGDSERLVVVEGDPTRAGAWEESIGGCDAIIALAGEPLLGQRWTAEFKRRLVDSRVEGMRRLSTTVAALPAERRPQALIAASAIGYYGSRGDEILDENSQPGSGFTAQLCSDWEAGAKAAEASGLRVAMLRIGIVVGDGGGILEKMVPAFRAFVGGPVGSGRQYLAWIHLDDLVGLVLLALDNAAVSGPLNLTAPQPVRMREFAQTLGKVLHRPALVPVPEMALKLLLGEGAQVPLASQRVVPRRALDLGYKFRYSELLPALVATLTP
jgi:uncharacterized protein (TIGR01777 family)